MLTSTVAFLEHSRLMIERGNLPVDGALFLG